MWIAITRPTGPELADCELTHLDRIPIDIEAAVEQHDVYLQVLTDLGVEVVELPRLPHHPDAVFVEDTALVLDEVAVLLRPGVDSRRGEVADVATALGSFRELRFMEAPATMDGGDLIVVGRTIIAGQTSRTGSEGAAALAGLVHPFGYEVVTVPVSGCLHLKTAATAAADDTIVVDPAHVDLTGIDAKLIEVHPGEAAGANVVAVGGTLLTDVRTPRTAERLRAHGYDIVALDVSEFAKAEGALTCKSLLFTSER